MRRVFSFFTVVIVFLSMFGAVGTAHAQGSLTYTGSVFVWGKGVVFVFEGTGFKNKDLKGAILFAESNDYKLSCWVNKDDGKVICVASGALTQYAGETGVITLAGYSFTVTLPGRRLPDEGDGSISCPEGSEPGATVIFFTRRETSEPYFVNGSSNSEVQNNAQNMLGEYFLKIENIGSLGCGEIPS